MPDNAPKWTPGPWQLQWLSDPYALAIVENSRHGSTRPIEYRSWGDASDRPLSKRLIAEFPMLRTNREVQANATLAAAAPDLYAALEAFTDGITRDRTNRMAKARAALAKARGEQTDVK